MRGFAALKPLAYLINVARGPVVNEEALVTALKDGRIAGAALDCVREEPMPVSVPLWHVENLMITPHTAGETRKYEDNVIDLLLKNPDRQWRGEEKLRSRTSSRKAEPSPSAVRRKSSVSTGGNEQMGQGCEDGQYQTGVNHAGRTCRVRGVRGEAFVAGQ